jgi:hypothetical protein
MKVKKEWHALKLPKFVSTYAHSLCVSVAAQALEIFY